MTALFITECKLSYIKSKSYGEICSRRPRTSNPRSWW